MNEPGGIGCDKAERDALDVLRDMLAILKHKDVANKAIIKSLLSEGTTARELLDRWFHAAVCYETPLREQTGKYLVEHADDTCQRLFDSASTQLAEPDDAA